MTRWNPIHWWKTLTLRGRIGVCAAVCLVLTFITYGGEWFGATQLKPAGWTFRVGSVMFFLWLAWPELRRIPRWVWSAALPILLVTAIRPQLLLFVIPIMIVYLYVLPKR